MDVAAKKYTYEMSLDDIEETSTQLVITIPFSRTNKRRVFTVTDEMDGISVLDLFRRYVALRSQGLCHNKLFVGYRNGNCISQRLGIHTICGVPKKIAEFLGLANLELYTGHSFRRTSETISKFRSGTFRSQKTRRMEEFIRGKKIYTRFLERKEKSG